MHSSSLNPTSVLRHAYSIKQGKMKIIKTNKVPLAWIHEMGYHPCGTKNDTLTYELHFHNIWWIRKRPKRIDRTRFKHNHKKSFNLIGISKMSVACLLLFRSYCNVNYSQFGVFCIQISQFDANEIAIARAALKYLTNWHDLYQFNTIESEY